MRITTLTAAFAFVVAVSSTVQGQAADPWIGVWKPNLAKSTFSPGPTPKTPGTVTIESAPGGGIKLVIDGMNAQGKPIHTESVGAFDGKDHPVKGAPNPNAMSAFKRIDARTIETQAKADGKTPTVTTRAVVSADGKTMTLTQTGQNIKGVAVKNVIVLERQ
jgi:hypothetical protein